MFRTVLSRCLRLLALACLCGAVFMALYGAIAKEGGVVCFGLFLLVVFLITAMGAGLTKHARDDQVRGFEVVVPSRHNEGR